MGKREEFLEALEACERTSASLLVAMESCAADPVSLATLRERQVETLCTVLPAALSADELNRLKAVVQAGEQVRLRALAEKFSATQDLASLSARLQVTRQLAATDVHRESGVDCLG